MTEPDRDAAPSLTSRPCLARPPGDLPQGPDWSGGFAAAPAPLLLLAPDLAVVQATDEWLTTTGVTAQRAVGRPLSDVVPLTDGAADLRAVLHRARRTGWSTGAAAVRADVLQDDGTTSERWWDVRVVPVLDERGAVAVLVVRTDEVAGAREESAHPHELGAGHT